MNTNEGGLLPGDVRSEPWIEMPLHHVEGSEELMLRVAAMREEFLFCQALRRLVVGEQVLLLRLADEAGGTVPLLSARLDTVSAIEPTRTVFPSTAQGTRFNPHSDIFVASRFWESVTITDQVVRVADLWFVNCGLSIALPGENSRQLAWIAKLDCSRTLLLSIPWLPDEQRTQLLTMCPSPKEACFE